MRLSLLFPSLLGLFAAPAALALDCQAATERELRRLGIAADAITAVRHVQKYNPTDHGPEVLGVRAWVDLKSCSGGYLVIDMTRSCFVRQSYTRGDCRIEGATAY